MAEQPAVPRRPPKLSERERQRTTKLLAQRALRLSLNVVEYHYNSRPKNVVWWLILRGPDGPVTLREQYWLLEDIVADRGRTSNLPAAWATVWGLLRAGRVTEAKRLLAGVVFSFGKVMGRDWIQGCLIGVVPWADTTSIPTADEYTKFTPKYHVFIKDQPPLFGEWMSDQETKRLRSLIEGSGLPLGKTDRLVSRLGSVTGGLRVVKGHTSTRPVRFGDQTFLFIKGRWRPDGVHVWTRHTGQSRPTGVWPVRWVGDSIRVKGPDSAVHVDRRSLHDPVTDHVEETDE